ncbi:MAG: energy-coupling factor ABC transporter permease [Candidatus Hodarchaeales archaeon]|jgi:cobalt/nickel transport system permease protein
MHIPDGWVDPIFLIITWILTIIILTISLRKLRDIDETRIAYMAVLSGTIFAAQMLNFPIFGGTSGHLLGGVLAASIVGPWGGVLVITVVLLIQALLFADGGILALGANIFNMGIVGVFIGYFIIRYMMLNQDPKTNRVRYYSGVFLGSLLSVVSASFLAAIEIGIPIVNNPAAIPFTVALPTILIYHMLIGIGEGIITSAIVLYFNTIDMNVFLELESTTFEISNMRG